MQQERPKPNNTKRPTTGSCKGKEGNEDLETNEAIKNTIDGSKQRKRWKKKKEKHSNNNNNNNNYNELNIFPLNMECFDKLKFRCLIKVVLNGPLTLYWQNALIERLYNVYKF